MNPRIQELILQCTDTVEIVNPDTGITHHREFFDHEKFALLIVQECLTFVEPMPGSGDIDDLALEAAHNSIKEHFGVEE